MVSHEHIQEDDYTTTSFFVATVYCFKHITPITQNY